MKLKYNFVPKKQKPGTTIQVGKIGILCLIVACIFRDGFVFAGSIFLVETIYLSYKATKARNK